MSSPVTRSVEPTTGRWCWVRTHMSIHDGSKVTTWGVQVAATGQWVGRVHPIGPEPALTAEALANAKLFAASKVMADVLLEATQAWSAQFDGEGRDDLSVSGADLVEWLAAWRLRARSALDAAGVP